MRNRILKWAKAEISMKLLAIGTLVALLVLLIPIVRIMMYCVPWYDDFSYGLLTKNYWDAEHTFTAALAGALKNVKQMWYAWQGTYTSCFFMSMMPATWGTDKYVYGLWFVLAMLLLGIFVLVNVLLTEVLKSKDRWANLAVMSTVAITVVLFMRSAIEGFFWYNSAVHYTAMHSLGMLYIAGLIKLVYAKNKVTTGLLLVLSMLGALVVGGVNNVTVLQVLLVMLSIIGFGVIFKKYRVFLLLPALAFYGFGMYKNLSSPGNAHRMLAYVNMRLSVPEAILKSFQSAFSYLDEFTGWMTLAIVVFMIPVVIYIVKKTDFGFAYPGLILAWSICLYATGFTPTLYTMGHTLLGRATNMAKVTFQLLLFINLFYLLGWICKKMQKQNRTVHINSTWSFCVIMAAVMLVIFAVEPNKGGIYSSYCAYYFVHTGEANNYYNEYLNRVAICEGEEKDVVVSPYVFKPWLLCLGDLSDDPEYGPNQFMASYFGKDSIVCKAPQQEEE